MNNKQEPLSLDSKIIFLKAEGCKDCKKMKANLLKFLTRSGMSNCPITYYDVDDINDEDDNDPIFEICMKYRLDTLPSFTVINKNNSITFLDRFEKDDEVRLSHFLNPES